MAGSVPPHQNIMQTSLELVRKIETEEIKGTFNIVTATVTALKNILSRPEYETAKQMKDVVVSNGKFLIDAFPMEESIGNAVRRILLIIRNAQTNTEDYSYLHEAVAADLEEESESSKSPPFIKATVMQEINDFEAELEITDFDIVNRAAEVLGRDEIIFTIGGSRLVERFLIEAAKTKPIKVIVAEGAPLQTGQEMAANLADAKITTTFIPDASIYDTMSKVNKVLLGANAVMRDGCLRGIVGSTTVAVIAQRFFKPVLVLLPLYKLSPRILNPSEKQKLNVTLPLETIYGKSNASHMKKIKVFNPKYDYVEPEFIHQYITNVGENSPQGIHKFISELYHPSDYDL